MTTLTIRIREDQKANLDDAAYRLGFEHMKGGEVRGDISTLLRFIAEALPHLTTDEIRELILTRKKQSQ